MQIKNSLFRKYQDPNKGETAVHGCHCPGDMVVRMRKVLAIPQSRSQSIRYFCPADGATNALEESKTEPQNPGSGLTAPA